MTVRELQELLEALLRERIAGPLTPIYLSSDAEGNRYAGLADEQTFSRGMVNGEEVIVLYPKHERVEVM